MRDTLGCIMQWEASISPALGQDRIRHRAGQVRPTRGDGNIRRIKGNSYLNDLKSGNAVAGIVWSGDLFILRAETENDNWQFTHPDSGGTLWSDNMMVPITSTTGAMPRS